MRYPALAVVLSSVAAPVLAHTGHGETSGFLHGLGHPILGPDHLLAMLGVGVWSGFALPRRLWAGAATFLAAMSLGAALSWAGIGIPMVETWILASVLLAGLLVVSARSARPRWQTGVSLAAIATFAACHGHAHATEASGAIAPYLAGFLISTALLHLAGIGVALGTSRSRAARVIQTLLGSALAGAGLLLMAG